MTQLTALKELAEKVEAGTEPTADDTWPIASCSSPVEGMAWAMCAVKSFGGSLDAAKALHEAVLPGWTWTVEKSTYNKLYEAWVRGEEAPGYTVSDQADPARAWLLAIIRAKISELEA